MAIALGRLVFWTVIASTPIALMVFSQRRWGLGLLGNLWRMFQTYKWHLFLFFVILVEKNFVDNLNDPIRGVFGDFTWLIYDIEGDAVFLLQDFFAHPWLTALLNVHYLWLYVFLNYFSVIYWAYRDDRELANLASLNYSIIYILAVPFYIFFNVQITSDFLPGMRSLLYHANPSFFNFFVAADPLDNAFPSLHIAIPFGLILVTWWTMRKRGYTLRDWEHRGFFWFIILNTAVFVFSILYLGIHWVTDIPGGLLIGLLGAIIAEEFQADVFRFFDGLERRVKAAWAPVWSGVRRLAGQPPA